jgi:hypothetical protein
VIRSSFCGQAKPDITKILDRQTQVDASALSILVAENISDGLQRDTLA